MRQLFDAGSGVGLSDRELVARFACQRGHAASSADPSSSEAAFEVLLARHGAMVLSVCRQVLGDPHAADDAFQATFLVLIRRGGSLRLRRATPLAPGSTEWLTEPPSSAAPVGARTRAGSPRRGVASGGE